VAQRHLAVAFGLDLGAALLELRARVSTAIGVFINPGRITLARMPYCAFW
jgi:hypothetical protein